MASTQTTQTFTYDLLGNLKQAVLPNKTINYGMDAHDRRFVKKVGSTVIEHYIWNYENQLKAITDQSGVITKAFVYGTKAHVPDYMITSTGDFQIVTDHLGSPVVVVNAATGEVVQEIRYDSFGKVVADTNPGLIPFGYAGCLYDQDTKLCRFGARDYDASIGRWTAKDPILFAGGDTNLYGYVMQDPINLIDPSGLAVGDWWDVVSNINHAEKIGNEVLASNPGKNGPGDAFRHAEWNRRMTIEINWFTAWSVATGYEIRGLIRGQPLNEAIMDLHNNSAGRDAGLNGRSIDISKLISSPENSYYKYEGVCQ